MKAPDKIYIHEASAPELAEPVLKEYHIEYIRKDMLIEWAKGEQSKCSDETHPYYQFMNVVLEKINSL